MKTTAPMLSADQWNVFWQDADELVLYSRSHHGCLSAFQCFRLIKKLANALDRFGFVKMPENCQLSYRASLRLKCMTRLLYKELGIWCYFAYLQGAQFDFLLQAESCLNKVNTKEGIDAEIIMYSAFVLWSKWQSGNAQENDMNRCFVLFEQCASYDSVLIPQPEVVWYRLGYLYQYGFGCSRNCNKAAECFERARSMGLDC